MTIHFRQAGDQQSTARLEGVLYFEPLPGRIQFTQKNINGGDVQYIEYGGNDDFLWNGKAYDFCSIVQD